MLLEVYPEDETKVIAIIALSLADGRRSLEGAIEVAIVGGETESSKVVHCLLDVCFGSFSAGFVDGL